MAQIMKMFLEPGFWLAMVTVFIVTARFDLDPIAAIFLGLIIGPLGAILQRWADK